jgi:hypothetical protein
MGIQTSKITTKADEDLSLNPAGTGKVIVNNLSGSGEVPVSVDTSGNIKSLDESEFDSLDASNPGDLVLLQREGQHYKVDASELGGLGLADPGPGDIIWFPTDPPGSGFQGDPFILTPQTVFFSGFSAVSLESCQIINQRPASLVLIEEVGGAVGSRMNQPAQIAGDDGSTPVFSFRYQDTPNTAMGTVYNGEFTIGSSTIFVAWDVTQLSNNTVFEPDAAPNASPQSVDYSADNKYGKGLGTWADGSRTLTSTENLLFNVNGGTLDASSKEVSDGDSVEIGYVESAVASASEGTVITGDLVSSDGGYLSSHSMVKDVTPSSFSIDSLEDQPLNSLVTTGNNPLSGVNAPTQISLTSGSLTDVKLSIAGTAFSSGPWTFNPGDLLQAQGVTGGSSSTVYNAVFDVGGVSVTWEVTTTDPDPSIAQPSIITPASGTSTGTPVTLSSDTYTPLNGAGPHQSSDWEIYSGGVGNPQIGPIESVNDKTVVYSDITNFYSPNDEIRNATFGFNASFGINSPTGAQDQNFAQTKERFDGVKIAFVFPDPLFCDPDIELGLATTYTDALGISYKINGVSYSEDIVPKTIYDDPLVSNTITLQGGLTGEIFLINNDDPLRDQAAFEKYLEPYLVPGVTQCKAQYITVFRGPFELRQCRGASQYSGSKAKFFGVWLEDHWLDDLSGATELFFDDSQADHVSTFVTGDNVTEVGNGDDGVGTVAYAHYIGDKLGSTKNKIVLSQFETNWDAGSYVKNTSKTVPIKTPPASDPPDPSNYSLVDRSLSDASNLESYTADLSSVSDNRSVFSHVKYYDDSSSGTLVESEWSPWHSLET